MRHLGTRVLETQRLLLRPFVLGDATAMHDNWASDAEVTKFLTWPTHESETVSHMVLTDWVSHYVEASYYQWAIVLKEMGQPIGSIAAVKVDDLADKVEVGYCIGRNWWHQGITSEALAEVIRFFLEEVGMNRVEATHDPNNPHSGAVMAKCGMRYEGILRQAGQNNQGLCDVCLYAISLLDKQDT